MCTRTGRTPQALARGLGIEERCVVPTISVGHEWRRAHVMYKEVRMARERRDARERRCAGAAQPLTASLMLAAHHPLMVCVQSFCFCFGFWGQCL
jgi:hypothetical protein